jgi:hypothetical protein
MSICQKNSYYSRIAAYLALRAIRKSAKPGAQLPVDFYPCGQCHALHLTSHGTPRNVGRFRH